MSSAFKEYNTRVEIHVDKMIQILLKAEGNEVNVSKTIDNLVFDMYVNFCLIIERYLGKSNLSKYGRLEFLETCWPTRWYR